MKRPILPLFLNRAGCPQECLFCNQSVSGETPVAPAAVLSYLAGQLERFPSGPVEIAFYGCSFTGLPEPIQEHLLSGVREVAGERGLAIRVDVRPDQLDEAAVERLRRNGVETVEIGVQSMRDDILRRLRRGHDAAAVRAAVTTARRAGLKVVLQLMYGLPDETVSMALGSLRAALALRPDGVRLHPALALAGTGLDALRAEGLYQPLSLARAVVWGARMLQLCHRAGVPVIRIGLQANTALSDPALAAGPFHPAMRSLVESELRRWRLLAEVRRSGIQSAEMRVWCAPRRRDYWAGHGGSNVRFLRQRFGITLRISPAEMTEDRIEWCEGGAGS
ncbi:radical SAM protein [bacterium]|nr:radical SAM protein [candidate division CSSED10-310 bacterium]